MQNAYVEGRDWPTGRPRLLSTCRLLTLYPYVLGSKVLSQRPKTLHILGLIFCVYMNIGFGPASPQRPLPQAAQLTRLLTRTLRSDGDVHNAISLVPCSFLAAFPSTRAAGCGCRSCPPESGSMGLQSRWRPGDGNALFPESTTLRHVQDRTRPAGHFGLLRHRPHPHPHPHPCACPCACRCTRASAFAQLRGHHLQSLPLPLQLHL